MNLALALLLCGSLPAQAKPADLDFGSGTLAAWEGEGFHVTTATGKGPSLAFGVCSSDNGKPGRTGVLHRTFVVPPGAGAIRFTAYARRPTDCPPTEQALDVYLLAAGNRRLPLQVRRLTGLQPVAGVLPPQDSRPREYICPVANLGGQTLRIALVDEDSRPGCHLFCSGFRILSRDEFEGREFGQFMLRLGKQHQLPPVERYDSKHFMALSTAGEGFTALRLNNCELIYDLFYDHFRKRGFKLYEPIGKMMVAVFDSQAGFDAFLGKKMPSLVTGVYQPGSNRLVVYDYGQNEAFVAERQQRTQEARKIRSDLDRQRFIDTVNRQAQEFRTEANIGTVMHEVAHQLSFNSGLLNREGDMPVWVAEGLACYCEATDNTSWQGIGEPNPERLAVLHAVVKANAKFIPLRDLVSSDAWLRSKNTNEATILLGYAQSWALFRMLMEERTAQMRTFLKLIYSRRTPDHRLADFGQAFGSDLARLELRYGEYMKQIAEREYRPRKQ